MWKAILIALSIALAFEPADAKPQKTREELLAEVKEIGRAVENDAKRSVLFNGIIKDQNLVAAVGEAAKKHKVVSIWFSLGGDVNTTITAIVLAYYSGVRFELKGPTCWSACAMLLSTKNVCVAPETEFGWHAAHDGKGNISRQAVEVIRNYIPQDLRDVLDKAGTFERVDFFRTVTGAELIKDFGFEECAPVQ